MKTHQPKLKTQLFSCSFFRHCTQTVLSPTTSHSPALPFSPTHPLPLAPQLPPLSSPSYPSPPPPPPQRSESSSSSSSTSQSFTQWKFPMPNSPIHPISQPGSDLSKNTTPKPNPPSSPKPSPIPSTNLQQLLHIAELQLTHGSDSDQLAALQLLESSLVPNPPTDPECPPELMRGVVRNLKNKARAKPSTKILLALCLAERNRHVAVEAGAVTAIIEAATELEDSAVERALAALELICTVVEGVAEVRANALAVPVMVAMMGGTSARGKEYAISVLGVIYGGAPEAETEAETDKEIEYLHAPPEEVARAVALALQGDCTPRGRRKGTQLLKVLEEK